eukprot:5375739-Pyramimonas_sp.AAC.1
MVAGGARRAAGPHPGKQLGPGGGAQRRRGRLQPHAAQALPLPDDGRAPRPGPRPGDQPIQSGEEESRAGRRNMPGRGANRGRGAGA